MNTLKLLAQRIPHGSPRGFLLMVAFLALLLGGCGQMGPLYPPGHKPPSKINLPV